MSEFQVNDLNIAEPAPELTPAPPELSFEERQAEAARIERHQYVNGLRAAADFYERATEVKLPSNHTDIANYVVNTKDDARAIIKALGSCKKAYDDDYFRIIKEISPGFKLSFILMRDNVCEKVQVGTKIVEEHIIPAEPAREEKLVPQRVEPIYEYHCPSVLSDDVTIRGR